MPLCHPITPTMLRRAHRIFLLNETLYIFYDLATELIREAWDENNASDLTVGISVLLQTWNRAFFQRRPFSLQDFRRIKSLLTSNWQILQSYRGRSILELTDDDQNQVTKLFRSFEKFLGPVGASKTMHLLAPNFFSLWDNQIAVDYRVRIQPIPSNRNSARYFQFMKCQQLQAQALGDQTPEGVTVLKAIDEFNYAHFTQGWM
jgi:hypothetical protein